MKKPIIYLAIFLAMAVIALIMAATPEQIPAYKKTYGYKAGFKDGSVAGSDCLFLQPEFNIREKAWLHGDMSNDYLQGCLDGQASLTSK